MKCRIVALVAPLLVVGSLSGQAATIPLGGLGSLDLKFIGDSFSNAGGFTDNYTFTMGAPADLFGAVIPIDFATGLNIHVSAPQLFSGTPNGNFALVGANPGCTGVACSWDIASAGSYFLQVAGNVSLDALFNVGQAGYFGGIISTPESQSGSQTPLPAALPLFASGLGGIGLFAWWRKRKARAVT